MSPSDSAPSLWRSVSELPGRTPLRVKLITAVLALVAIALAVISVTGISVLKGYLLDQADGQLALMHAEASNHRFGGGGFGGPFAPEHFVVEAVTSTGQTYPADNTPSAGQTGPLVPNNASWLTANRGQPVTVPARSGGGRWRVIVYPGTSFDTPSGDQIGGTLVIGVDVSSQYRTISSVTRLDLIVSAILLLGLAIVGVAVVRASLRPLDEIERTAEGIAAGDLTRRVPDEDPRTEVGRLGRSLNAMLAQIETAFYARTQSETAARRSEEAARRSEDAARQSAATARRSEARMRQFAADASHELRTPLTAIRGFAEYYRQRGGVTGPDLDRIIRRVEQEATRMGVMVDDMLLLARLDQQRPLEFRTVDLLAIAADAVHDARVIAPARTITLNVATSDAPLVPGDEVRLRQVVGNLMSNAMTHTPDGSPIEVTIRSGALDQAAERAARNGSAPVTSSEPVTGSEPVAGIEPAATGEPVAASEPAGRGLRPAVILEVADQGQGLTGDQAEHVFERFYRTDRARTRTAGGTGLGLAIVAALVAAHHGRVWVSSQPQQGATFGFALPLAPEAIGNGAEEHP